MKISALIKKLEKLQEKHGNVDVMAQDLNSDSVWSIGSAKFNVAEEDDYPEDWDMPAGYKFIMIGN